MPKSDTRTCYTVLVSEKMDGRSTRLGFPHANMTLNEGRFWSFLLDTTRNEVISFQISEKRETTKVVSTISELIYHMSITV